MKRHDEAMVSFASALELADNDEEKYDTLLQIIAIGSELEGVYCLFFLMKLLPFTTSNLDISVLSSLYNNVVIINNNK